MVQYAKLLVVDLSLLFAIFCFGFYNFLVLALLCHKRKRITSLNILHAIHLLLVMLKTVTEWIVMLNQEGHCELWRVSSISYYGSYLVAQYILVLKTRKIFNVSQKLCILPYFCMLAKIGAGIAVTLFLLSDTFNNQSCVLTLEFYSFISSTIFELATSASILLLTIIGYRANPTFKSHGLYNALEESNLVGVTMAGVANIGCLLAMITLHDPLQTLITMHADFLVFTIAVSWLILDDMNSVTQHQKSSHKSYSLGSTTH